jgi:DNA-binding NarL/FixJ family response regulator
MQHWIIDREVSPMPVWLEAMPAAQFLDRRQLGTARFAGPGVIWSRLHAGEPIESALDSIDRSGGQPVVLLSDVPDEAQVLQALAHGAAGCCNSRAAPEVLRQVAVVVGNGGLWVGQSLLRQLVGATTRRLGQQPVEAEIDAWRPLLSEREIQVARLVASGASNREIADRLEITERTVKAHLTAIFEKLGVRDRLQLSLRVNGLRI